MTSSRTKALEMAKEILGLIANAASLQALAQARDEANTKLINANNYMLTQADEMNGFDKAKLVANAQDELSKKVEAYNLLKAALEKYCKVTELQQIYNDLLNMTETEASIPTNQQMLDEIVTDLEEVKNKIEAHLQYIIAHPYDHESPVVRVPVITTYLENCIMALGFLKESHAHEIVVTPIIEGHNNTDETQPSETRNLYDRVVEGGYDAFAEYEGEFETMETHPSTTTESNTTFFNNDHSNSIPSVTASSHEPQESSLIISAAPFITIAEVENDEKEVKHQRVFSASIDSQRQPITSSIPVPSLSLLSAIPHHRSVSAPIDHVSPRASSTASSPSVTSAPPINDFVSIASDTTSTENNDVTKDKTKKAFNSIKKNLAKQIASIQAFISTAQQRNNKLIQSLSDPNHIDDKTQKIIASNKNSSETMKQHVAAFDAILQELESFTLPNAYDLTHIVAIITKIQEFNTPDQDNATRKAILTELSGIVATLKADVLRLQLETGKSLLSTIDMSPHVTSIPNSASSNNSGVTATGPHSGKIEKRNLQTPAAVATTSTEKNPEDEQSPSEKRTSRILDRLKFIKIDSVDYGLKTARLEQKTLKDALAKLQLKKNELQQLMETLQAAKGKQKELKAAKTEAVKIAKKISTDSAEIKNNDGHIKELARDSEYFKKLIDNMEELVKVLAEHRHDMDHDAYNKRMNQFQNKLKKWCAPATDDELKQKENNIKALLLAIESEINSLAQQKELDDSARLAHTIENDIATGGINPPTQQKEPVKAAENINSGAPLMQVADPKEEKHSEEEEEEAEEKEFKNEAPKLLPILQSHYSQLEDSVLSAYEIEKAYEAAIASAVIASDPLKNLAPIQRYKIIFGELYESKDEKRQKKYDACIKSYEGSRAKIAKIDNHRKGHPINYPWLLHHVACLENLLRQLGAIKELLENHGNDKNVIAFSSLATHELPHNDSKSPEETKKWAIIFSKWIEKHSVFAFNYQKKLDKQKANPKNPPAPDKEPKGKAVENGPVVAKPADNINANPVAQKEEKVIANAAVVVDKPAENNNANPIAQEKEKEAVVVQDNAKVEASTLAQPVANTPVAQNNAVIPAQQAPSILWDNKFAILLTVLGIGAGAALTFFTVGLGTIALLQFIAVVSGSGLVGGSLFGAIGHQCDNLVQQKHALLTVDSPAIVIPPVNSLIINGAPASQENNLANNQQPLIENNEAPVGNKAAPVDPNSVKASQNGAALLTHRKRTVFKHKEFTIPNNAQNRPK